ncbi:MAG TPA: membrane protein insertion efficiency factor YidD [Trueperaceae bacterium]|nr:membrane protein insertion efficiency factor YidD [Trueperaceae bacterium]
MARLIRTMVLAPIRLYRRYLSPLKPTPSCRFHPTCSEYALQAVETRGVLVGVPLAIWRVLRCNPFNKGGYDPVPPRRSKRINGDVSSEAT